MGQTDIDPAKVTDQQYELLAARRSNYDGMLWQTPALSLTAQAFLFTIALGDGSKTSRIIASCLAFFVAVASAQLLSKHRYLEYHCSCLLEKIEAAKSLQPLHGKIPNARGMAGFSSFRIWNLLLWLFGFAALLIGAMAVCEGD